MPIKTILFDLDGTLLPMDQEVFVKTYMKLLAAQMAPYGYDPQLLVKGLWDGTAAMVKNDGRSTNETVFWNTFCALMGRDARKDEAVFEAFYREEFQRARAVCGFAPQAAETVRGLKKRGFRVVLATNPVFPAVATQSRVRWAGLTPGDFDFYTTYENSSFCKPNPAYYREILDRIGCPGEACVMVGNDVSEDMAAETLGMRTFLLTDCLINREGRDIRRWPHGDFTALEEFFKTV